MQQRASLLDVLPQAALDEVPTLGNYPAMRRAEDGRRIQFTQFTFGSHHTVVKHVTIVSPVFISLDPLISMQSRLLNWELAACSGRCDRENQRGVGCARAVRKERTDCPSSPRSTACAVPLIGCRQVVTSARGFIVPSSLVCSFIYLVCRWLSS